MAYQIQGGLADFTKYGQGGAFTNGLSQFLPTIGMNLNDWYTAGGGNAEHGNYEAPTLNPALGDKLSSMGYTFGQNKTADNGMTMDVLQNGNVVGNYQTSDADSWIDKIGPLAPLLVGGAGLLAGGLGGAAAGASGAGAAGGGAMSMGEAIAAAGSATTPAAVGGSTLAAGAGGTGLLSTLKNAAGAIGLTPGQALGGGLGLLAGMDSTKDQTQTSMQKMDPRMDALVYGQGGLLPAAQQWFQQNQQPNQMMQQGANLMGQFYSSPQYGQQFGQLRDTGMGLLSKGIAGNPFMGG